jgi:dephospho-CoA kinase
MKQIIYVGVTGGMGCGKGTAIESLGDEYKFNSLSDILREEVAQRGIENIRENLIDMGNQLREELGLGVLGSKMADKLKNSQYNQVIDSIRHPKEVKALRENLENFVLIAITAPPRTRYERTISRKRTGDAQTFEGFQKLDKKDHDIGIQACIEFSDYRIENDGISLEELNSKFKECIDDYVSIL